MRYAYATGSPLAASQVAVALLDLGLRRLAVVVDGGTVELVGSEAAVSVAREVLEEACRSGGIEVITLGIEGGEG